MPVSIKLPTAVLMLEKQAISSALRQAGRLVLQEAKSLIQNSSGTPGEAPKSRTGKLAASLRVSARKGTVRVTAGGTDGVAYALALEHGSSGGGGVPGEKSTRATKGHGRSKRGVATTLRQMAARPFLTTALENRSDEISRRVTEAVMTSVSFKVTK